MNEVISSSENDSGNGIEIKTKQNAAQIFEEALIPYMQKILGILSKKARDGGSDLHGVISDTMGMMTFYIV